MMTAHATTIALGRRTIASREVAWLLGVTMVILSALVSDAARAVDAPGWQVSVAVPESNGERSIQFDQTAHFHVLLTNVTASPQKIWKESDSWGYAALSFELKDATGKAWTVRKKERPWRKNTPAFWTVASRETLVYDVTLADGRWEGMPPSPREKRFTIRAIVEIKVDEKTREHGIWTGRVLSNSSEIVFR
jgi:hypothetical protein